MRLRILAPLAVAILALSAIVATLSTGAVRSFAAATPAPPINQVSRTYVNQGPLVLPACATGDGYSQAPCPPLSAQFAGTLTIATTGCGKTTPAGTFGVTLAETLPVTAIPCPGSAFTGWKGGPCNGTTINPCDIAALGSGSVTATFAP